MPQLTASRAAQALIALSSAPPMRGACYMTVMPLYLNDTFGAGPAEVGAAALNLKFTGLTHNFPVDPAV